MSIIIEDREQLRRERLAEGIWKSIKEAEREAFKLKGKKEQKLSAFDKSRIPRVISDVKAGGNKAFVGIMERGLREPKKGEAYLAKPKYKGYKGKELITRKALIESGLPEELVEGLMKDQASRIRIPRTVKERASRIANFLGISLVEALKIPQDFELA